MESSFLWLNSTPFDSLCWLFGYILLRNPLKISNLLVHQSPNLIINPYNINPLKSPKSLGSFTPPFVFFPSFHRHMAHCDKPPAALPTSGAARPSRTRVSTATCKARTDFNHQMGGPTWSNHQKNMLKKELRQVITY